MPHTTAGHEERWKREAEFFDAEEYVEGAIPEVTVRRYLELREPWLSAEYLFHVLGDVKGKTVLEIGSGDGFRAVILALRGANVVGIDLSRRAVEVATERARLHGVADRARFICSSLEEYTLAETKQYDIIIGTSILHHLLPVLETFLVDLKKFAHPGTVFLFKEPVSLWQWLRKLRLALPISTEGTPDERPLNHEDMAIIRRQFPRMQVRYFGAVQRIFDRFWVRTYETLSLPMRVMYNVSSFVDYVLLHGFRLVGLASIATIVSGRE